MSKYSETRRVKKNLPYTVSAIPDIAAWRVEQIRFEEQHQLKKEAKRSMIIQGMEDGSLLAKSYGVSKTTLTNNTYLAKQKELLDRHYSTNLGPMSTYKHPSKSQQLTNSFTGFYNKFVNWLISFKF